MKNERNAAIFVVAELQQHGHIAVFAGGCVRNEMLGRIPNDYDVATSALPDEVEAIFSGVRTIAVGKAFGIIKVLVDGAIIDVATLRADGQYIDGRRPDSVKYVKSLRKDASRREFTINAMFMDPLSSEVIDFNGGKADLEAGVIRCVGSARKRIAEDKLRMLRAARFAARYGFRIDKELAEAIKNSAHTLTSGKKPLSFERVAHELEGILVSDNPLVGLDFLMESGLMQEIIPELVECNGPSGEQDPVWHPEGNTWAHTRMVVSHLIGSSFELMLGGLLHDVGKPATQRRYPTGRISNHGHAEVGCQVADVICRRLKLSNLSRHRVTELVRLHMQMHLVKDLRPGKLTALLAREDITDLMALQHADALGNGYKDRVTNSHRQYLSGKLDELKDRIGQKALVTGDTLIGLGYRPGPVFKAMLEAAMDAQREGTFTTADEAFAWSFERFGDKDKAGSC